MTVIWNYVILPTYMLTEEKIIELMILQFTESFNPDYCITHHKQFTNNYLPSISIHCNEINHPILISIDPGLTRIRERRVASQERTKQLSFNPTQNEFSSKYVERVPALLVTSSWNVTQLP